MKHLEQGAALKVAIRQCRNFTAAVVLLVILSVTTTRLNAQEEAAGEATRLNDQVEALFAAGRYQEAIPLAQRALAIRETVFGSVHPGVAESASNLAVLHEGLGDYAKAQPLFQRALAISEKVNGLEHQDVALFANNLAVFYQHIGDYTKAEPLLQRALSIREKVRGPEHTDTALSLLNLASLYEATAMYTKAEPLFQRALAIFEKALGPEHPEVAKTLSNLANFYQSIGAHTKAEPLYQRAISICEKALGAEHPYVALYLENLSSIYIATGAYAHAETLTLRALAIREKVFGPENLETSHSLNNLAAIYDFTGAYSKAEPLYLRALSIREKALGPEHRDTALSLNNLASMYQDTGAYTKAEPLLERALRIQEKALGAEHPGTALLLSNLATLYRDTGAYAKAETLFRRSLSIREKVLGPEHPDTAISLSNLGNLYQDRGAYAKAEPLLERALAIQDKNFGLEHRDTALFLNYLALLYQSTGAYAKAEPLHQRALAIRERVLGPEHTDTAESLSNLAELYKSTGAYAKAELLQQRAAAILEKVAGSEHPDTAKSLSNLATLYFATGAYSQAESLNERVQRIDEQNALRFLYSGSESRKQQYVRQRLQRVSANISLSLAHPTAKSTALGYTSVLQYKGRVLDIMSDSLARLRSSVAPQDRVLLDELTAVAQEFSTLAYRGAEKLSAAAYRERLQALARQQEELQAQLTSRSAVLTQTLAPITLDTVHAALPKDAILVEWFRHQPFNPKLEPSAHRDTQPHYVAYVIEHDGKPVGIDVGEARPIEDLIAEFRRALVNPTTASRGANRADPARRDVTQLAAALGEKLLKPLRPHLSPSKRLLISPDGALNLVPFAALLDEHGHPLAQQFEISYLTSGRDLLRTGDVPVEGASVVLAAPAYGRGNLTQPLSTATLQPMRSAELDRSGLVFRPLPGTVAEAKALQSLLELAPQQLLTGERATEAQLRSLHGPRILHLATHGFFLKDEDLPTVFSNGWDERAAASVTENPLLRSGLALAGANDRRSGDADDGILTAAEVAQLDLAGTQLVVLSACETALGTVNAGEGVYGLRRALALAGAQSQLVSLWKVDDAATQRLMTEYYRRLLQGEGRAAALRSVQLSMLADPAHRHPYYWAAFIPIGSWTPLAR